MPLTQRSRSALYHGLTELIDDDQAVEEMLSYFPSRDVEEPVTKEFLRAEMADIRAEMADIRAEMADLRSDLRAEMAELRTDLRAEMADIRAEMAELRTDMHAGFRRLTISLYGSMIAFGGVLVAAGAIAS